MYASTTLFYLLWGLSFSSLQYVDGEFECIYQQSLREAAEAQNRGMVYQILHSFIKQMSE